jgi:hypothetical protein
MKNQSDLKHACNDPFISLKIASTMNSRPCLFWYVALLVLLAFSSLAKSEVVEGRIEVLVSDNFIDGSSHNHVFLHEHASGKRIPLEVSSIGPKVHELRTGMFGKALVDFSAQGALKRDNSQDSLDPTSVLEDEEMPIKIISLEWVRLLTGQNFQGRFVLF